MFKQFLDVSEIMIHALLQLVKAIMALLLLHLHVFLNSAECQLTLLHEFLAFAGLHLDSLYDDECLVELSVELVYLSHLSLLLHIRPYYINLRDRCILIHHSHKLVKISPGYFSGQFSF